MQQDKTKPAEISLDLSDPNFGKTMVFDGFALRRRGDIVFSCFWRKGESGDIEDRFSTAIAVGDLSHDAVSEFKTYIAKVGIAPAKRDFQAPLGIDFRDSRMVRFIRCSRFRNVGEFGMYFVPLSFLCVPSPKAVRGAPVVALVSDINLHVDYLDALIRLAEERS